MKKTIISSPLTKRLLIEMGENLRLSRLRRNLSIRAIAHRTGVSVNTVASLEKGSPGVSVGVLANILHSLGLADDIALLAKDDLLGRKLQDLELLPKKRASKRKMQEEI